VREAVIIAVLINAVGSRSDPTRHRPSRQPAWLTRFADLMGQGIAVRALGRFEAPGALITSLFELG
jgi:hypothetical protein